MQFLKILFWSLLAFVAALFTYGNWTHVPIRLFGGLEALVRLPFLLLVTFLAGLLPTLAWQSARRWRLRQRLTTAERTIADLRAPLATAPAAAPATSAPATSAIVTDAPPLLAAPPPGVA